VCLYIGALFLQYFILIIKTLFIHLHFNLKPIYPIDFIQMKKMLFLLALVLVATNMYAANATDFNIDDKEVTVAMADLSTAEVYVNAHPNATLDEVKAAAGDLNLSTNFAQSLGTEPPYGVPSFVWGLCLGWIGLVVVYIVTDNDKAEVKKALMGTLVGMAIGVVLYAVVLLSFFGCIDAISFPL
jgi:hypothetical protein